MIPNDQVAATDIVNAVMVLQHVDELQLILEMMENLSQNQRDKLIEKIKGEYDLYTLDEARDCIDDEELDEPQRDESRE